MANDWDDDWGGDDDDAPSIVVQCPACGAHVYEDAEQCPACGDYIVHDTGEWAGRPGWWIVLGTLGIIAVIYVLIVAGF